MIVIDGVRGQEIFGDIDLSLTDRLGLSADELDVGARLMPHLHRLMTCQGAIVGAPQGAGMFASGPNFISLPSYLEIFTGDHTMGRHDNDFDALEQPTIADDFAAQHATRPEQVAVIASWPTIARAASNGGQELIVSAGRSAGHHLEGLTVDAKTASLLENGKAAEPWPGRDDYRPDQHTAAIALQYLGTQDPRFLFIGLGDSDELGHHDDYRGYLSALAFADRTIAQVVEVLNEPDRDRTWTLFVLTDHGRSHGFTDHGKDWPESGRVWLAATGDNIRARGTVANDRPRHLADVAPTVRAAAGLPARSEPNQGQVINELFTAPNR